MRLRNWLALLGLLAFLGLANPATANGGTLAALTLVPVLIYTMPAFGRSGGGR
ncbi:hypothetical protein [Rothia sp. P4278]|uniref:hypothetical protein n=1 Tax=Rothia sp. P4278 TaxID=3402658 RepID=UPI003AE07864